MDLSFLRLEFARNLLGLGSARNGRNLLGMVGIWLEWSEFGRNESEHLAGPSLKIHSYQIPSIPSKFLPFRADPTKFCSDLLRMHGLG